MAYVWSHGRLSFGNGPIVPSAFSNTVSLRPPGAEAKVRTRPLTGIDESELDLERIGTATGMHEVLTVAGRGGAPTANVAMTDSIAKVFAAAVRNAAMAQVAMAGDQCAGDVASAIATRGQPTGRHRGSNSATEFFEKLTWNGQGSSTTVSYVWSSKIRGCRTESH